MTTTEKSEEQIVREKKAVDQLRGAKSAMEQALDRINDLERVLKRAREHLVECKRYISPEVYTYREGATKQETVHQKIAGWVATMSMYI